MSVKSGEVWDFDGTIVLVLERSRRRAGYLRCLTLHDDQAEYPAGELGDWTSVWMEHGGKRLT